MKPKVISILGMHRSGTSCLTGMLENAGLKLGLVSRQNPHNKKGNNENQGVVVLHEAVLAANQCCWDAPIAGGCKWNQEHFSALRELVGAHAHLESWGFKDPRTLFTLEGWIQVVPEIRFVGSFRHPCAVAKSLMVRGGGSRDRYLELWYAYNRRLLYFHDTFRFDLVNFDDGPDAYIDRVTTVARHLELNPAPGVLTFFDNRLRTQRADQGDMPHYVNDLYQELLSRAR
ncbi:MAG: sulfotransferase family protein [Gammaproteobacteria bacterium]